MQLMELNLPEVNWALMLMAWLDQIAGRAAERRATLAIEFLTIADAIFLVLDYWVEIESGAEWWVKIWGNVENDTLGRVDIVESLNCGLCWDGTWNQEETRPDILN